MGAFSSARPYISPVFADWFALVDVIHIFLNDGTAFSLVQAIWLQLLFCPFALSISPMAIWIPTAIAHFLSDLRRFFVSTPGIPDPSFLVPSETGPEHKFCISHGLKNELCQNEFQGRFNAPIGVINFKRIYSFLSHVFFFGISIPKSLRIVTCLDWSNSGVNYSESWSFVLNHILPRGSLATWASTKRKANSPVGKSQPNQPSSVITSRGAKFQSVLLIALNA